MIKIPSLLFSNTLVLFGNFKKSLLHRNGTKLGDFYGSHYVTTKKEKKRLDSNKLTGGGGGGIVSLVLFTVKNDRYWKYAKKYAKYVIGLVFGDEFLAQGLHLKSHQRCSAAFCRPVKFFHAD